MISRTKMIRHCFMGFCVATPKFDIVKNATCSKSFLEVTVSMRGTAYIAAVLLGTALFGQLRTGGPGYLRRMELCNAHSA